MRILCAIVVAIACVTPKVGGQVTSPMTPALPTVFTRSDEIDQQQERSGASVPVTVIAKDSTVDFVVREVMRQARLRAVYDNAGALTKKRVTVKMVKRSAMDALSNVLLGTGFVAKLTSDGETVVIRPADWVSEKRQAEFGTVRGRVTDTANNSEIRGATVALLGTTLRTMTDEQGRFTLVQVPLGEWVISIKAFGYRSAERKVVVRDSGGVTIRVVLSPTATTLSGVVTTATGKQRRVEMGNDIAVINADSLIKTAPITSVTDLIAAARVPGVIVTPTSGQPGAPSRIRIGGIGSIMQSNDPVVVVDGVWVNASTSTRDVLRSNGEAASGTTTYNQMVPSRLDDIDPNAIESIEILRGPSAAALYGTDAANGVIVITTKHGRIGTTRWGVRFGMDWDEIPTRYQPMYQGWGRHYINGLVTQCPIVEYLDGYCQQDSVSTKNLRSHPLLTNEASGRKAHYNLTLDGGTSALQYAFTASIRDELGADRLPRIDAIRLVHAGEQVPRSLERPNTYNYRALTARLTARPKPAFDLGLSMTVSQTMSNTAGLVFNSSKSFDSIFVSPTGMSRTDGKYRSTTGLLSLSADWTPLRWAIPHLDVGIERTNGTDNKEFQSNVCWDGGCDVPRFEKGVGTQERSVYTLRGRVAFPLSLGVIDRFVTLRPSIGMDVKRNLANTKTLNGRDLARGSRDLGTASNLKVSDKDNNSAVAGWYTDVQIGVLQRFYTSVGFRRDVGSALSNHITPPVYPKIGTSWLISDEGWFPRTSLLSELRVRGAFGHSSIQPEASALAGSYLTNSAYVNGQTVNGIVLTGIGNPALKPERAIELEYGVDAGFFNTRAQLSATLISKRSRNVLLPKQLPPSVGGAGTSVFVNVAQVSNRAVLLVLDSRIVERTSTVWTGRVTFSSQVNRVDRVGFNQPVHVAGQQIRVVKGYPLNAVWSRPVLGYNDVNGNGILVSSEVILGDSLTYVGSGTPRYSLTYGTSLSLLRGLISFSADLAYDGDQAQIQETYDGWGAQDPHAPLYEQAYARIASLTGNRQTFSVLRLTAASAQFLLPIAWTRALRAQSASITWRASNLGMWSQYRGRDPAVNSVQGVIGEGVADDGFTLPPPRTYSLLLQLTF